MQSQRDKIEQVNYVKKRIKYDSKSEIYLFPTSDWHLDNVKCKRQKLKEHLDYIVEKKGFISIHGDMGCLMQGRYDPRSSKSDLDSLFKSANYMDDVVEYHVEFLLPYVDHIVAISDGNHETSVNKRTETNFIRRVIRELKHEKPNDIQYMPYAGVIDYMLEHKSGGGVRSFKLGFHHGAWGGIVSKGTQGVPRFSSIHPDVDAFYSGHTHDQWFVRHPQFRIKQNGDTPIVDQIHIKGGTFKEEFGTMSGWATEKIVMPKSIGSSILRLRVQSGELKRDVLNREF